MGAAELGAGETGVREGGGARRPAPPRASMAPAGESQLFLLLLICFLSVACSGPSGDERGAETPSLPPPVPNFTDVTAESGVRFVHFNDATARRLLPETMGAGVALFDFDDDGDADVYFVNGTGLSSGATASGALYENLGGWRFRDVTAAAGLSRPIYGMGAAVGDVDGDGWLDLFVSGLGEDRLYRNLGGRGFEDVSARFGLGPPGFSSSAAFLDYDRDGRLDLYVARYVDWSLAGDVRCAPDGTNPTYCTPEVYEGSPNLLLRNVDGRRFEEVTLAAGLWWPEGKSLGVVVLDVEGDGWPDLAVANDTSRNTLYRNLGRGAGAAAVGGVHFEEVGIEAGFAFSESGATRGGMGIDAGDVDGDRRPDLAVGNFAQEMSALYRALGGGLFIDDAAQRGVGLPTLLPLAFGTLLFDRDGDGDLDLALVNGHIEPDIERTRPLHTYAQPPQLFDNDGAGRFTAVEPPPGDAFAAPLVGRGLAAADLDGDGDLDLVVTQNGRPARLYRNESNPRRWLRVALVGRGSAAAYGATVRVVAGERSWRQTLVSGRSYLSASEPVLTFGLDDVEKVDRVEVTWPSGKEQTIESPEINRTLEIDESGRGS